MIVGDFQESVLKLHEETGKNDENEPAQVGANNGPNENAKKSIFPVLFFNIFAHILAPAAQHMASALSAPLAKMCKKQLVLLIVDDFHNSVLKPYEETGENDENEPAQVGANRGPNENAKKLIFPLVFNIFAHLLALVGLLATHTLCKHK